MNGEEGPTTSSGSWLSHGLCTAVELALYLPITVPFGLPDHKMVSGRWMMGAECIHRPTLLLLHWCSCQCWVWDAPSLLALCLQLSGLAWCARAGMVCASIDKHFLNRHHKPHQAFIMNFSSLSLGKNIFPFCHSAAVH